MRTVLWAEVCEGAASFGITEYSWTRTNRMLLVGVIRRIQDDGEEEPTSFAARRKKAHAGLAFLWDESDSN